MAEHSTENAGALPNVSFSGLHGYFARRELNLGDFAGDQAGLEQAGPYVADFIIEETTARAGQPTFEEIRVRRQRDQLAMVRRDSRAGFAQIARPAFQKRAQEAAAEVPEIRLLQTLIADMHEKSPDATFLAENVLLVYGSLKHPSSEQLLRQAHEAKATNAIGRRVLSSRPA
jgi:hypothetical protein